MRAIIAVLSIVAGIGNAAYLGIPAFSSAACLGIPAISRLDHVPVHSASWASHTYSTTEEKLEASGAALMWGGTVTALAVLPWIKEPQRSKWYVPVACACLGGAAIYLTGLFMAKR
jgi:hypothetical protein